MSETRVGYFYGMRLRGFSPGAQPMTGFIERMDVDEFPIPVERDYYDILAYAEPLSKDDEEQYDLDYLGRAVV